MLDVEQEPCAAALDEERRIRAQEVAGAAQTLPGLTCHAVLARVVHDEDGQSGCGMDQDAHGIRVSTRRYARRPARSRSSGVG